MRARYPLPVLSLDDWPARDRAAWAAALRPASLLEDRDSLSRFPEARIPRFAEAWGRWLGYLAHVRAWDGSDEGSGLDYLDRAHLEGFLDVMMAHLASCSVRAYVTDLRTLVHHMDPGSDHEDLHRATLWVWRRARPERNKVQRIVPAGELYALGFELMEAAEAIRQTGTGEMKATEMEPKKIKQREIEQRVIKQSDGAGEGERRQPDTGPQYGEAPPLQALQLFRDGLMIALLAARPLRMRNFIALEIDRHVFRLEDRYRLAIAATETKAGRAYEIDLPDSLTDPLDTYISLCRPHLLSRHGRWSHSHDGTALWISRDGTPYSYRGLYDRLIKHTRARFGRRVNPHLFRDCAATSIAVEVPEAVGIIAPVLGHASARTGERHYNQARSMVAGRAYLDVIASFRESTR